MAVTVEETVLGVEGDAQGARLSFKAFSEPGDDLADVLAAVASEAPSSFNGHALTNVGFKALAPDPESMEPAAWEIEVTYGRFSGRLVPPATDTTVWTCSTAGGTQRVTNSRSARVWSEGGEISLLAGQTSIGATKDSIEGTDVIVPVLAMRATRYVANAALAAFTNAAWLLTGKVNDGSFATPFGTYPAAEVLCFGITGAAQRTDAEAQDWEVTIEFAANPNVTDLEFGDIMVGEKKGWEYLDFAYEDFEDDTESVMVKKLLYVKTHELYSEGDFSALGL